MCKHGRLHILPAGLRGLGCSMGALFFFLISFFLLLLLGAEEGMPRSQGAGLQNGSIVTGIGKKSTVIHVPKNMSGWISVSVCLYSSFKQPSIPEKRNEIARLWSICSTFFFNPLIHTT